MPQANPAECTHMDFEAHVDVCRLTDSRQFQAEVRVRCAQCKRQFQFVGLEPGVDLQGARCSLDALEARLAICPQGELPSPADRMIVNIGTVPGIRH